MNKTVITEIIWEFVFKKNRRFWNTVYSFWFLFIALQCEQSKLEGK